MSFLQGTLTPFLYPCLLRRSYASLRHNARINAIEAARRITIQAPHAKQEYDPRLNPRPDEYSRSLFTDKCTLSIEAGSGGHGCVSFLREKFVPDGPPNGGDGGTGGSIYIQAVPGETSLHKIARKGAIRAGRGKNGQGKAKGGQRGEDVLLQVPVGTVIRETFRNDPVAREEKAAADLKEEIGSEDQDQSSEGAMVWKRNKWLLSPTAMPSEFTTTSFPALPRPRRSNLAVMQPQEPIYLDLSKPMSEPIVLAAGAVGGMGNPHFVTKSITKPKFATKGDRGMKLQFELELKLLADLGFVGLPNAGKSTLLRALSSSRARIGDWAFTTLQPNIGTVVLDNNQGRPRFEAFNSDSSRRKNFTIADIPGLVPDAHLDKGLGLDFLRHVERAKVLAFVVDLSKGDAVATLQMLKRELDEFEKLKEAELNEQSQRRFDNPQSDGRNRIIVGEGLLPSHGQLSPLGITPISAKPWFVVANKADLEGTEDNFRRLKIHVQKEWGVTAIPVSAIRAEGTNRIPEHTTSLLS